MTTSILQIMSDFMISSSRIVTNRNNVQELLIFYFDLEMYKNIRWYLHFFETQFMGSMRKISSIMSARGNLCHRYFIIIITMHLIQIAVWWSLHRLWLWYVHLHIHEQNIHEKFSASIECCLNEDNSCVTIHVRDINTKQHSFGDMPTNRYTILNKGFKPHNS